jgi:hypothetical protein
MARGLLVWELILALCDLPHEAEVTADGGRAFLGVDTGYSAPDFILGDDELYNEKVAKLEEAQKLLAEVSAQLSAYYDKHFGPDAAVPAPPFPVAIEAREMLDRLFEILPEDDRIPF